LNVHCLLADSCSANETSVAPEFPVLPEADRAAKLAEMAI
jgi:hypothetical protein